MKTWIIKGWFLLVMFGAGTIAWGESPQGTPPTALPALRVVLVKINSYSQVKEIRSLLENFPGVTEIRLLSETPGLIVFGVESSGKPELVTLKIKENLPQAIVTQKSLPNGVVEINIAKGS